MSRTNGAFWRPKFTFLLDRAITFASLILTSWSVCEQWFQICGLVSAECKVSLGFCRWVRSCLSVSLLCTPYHILCMEWHRLLLAGRDDLRGLCHWTKRIAMSRWVCERFKHPVVSADALWPLMCPRMYGSEVAFFVFLFLPCLANPTARYDEAPWVSFCNEQL